MRKATSLQNLAILATAATVVGSLISPSQSLYRTWSGNDKFQSPLVNVPAKLVNRRAELSLASVEVLAPFGRVDEPQFEPSNATSKTVQLTLLGVMLNASPDHTVALISKEGKEQGYRLGEQIVDGIILKSVDESRAYLDVNGSDVILPMSAPSPVTLLDTVHVKSKLEQLRDRAANQRQEAPEGVSNSNAARFRLWLNGTKLFSAQLLEEIGLIETPNGYIVADDHDMSVRLAGLRAQDLIKRIDRKATNVPHEANVNQGRVLASRVVQIEVIRQGARIILAVLVD